MQIVIKLHTFGSSDISSNSVVKRKIAEQIVYLNYEQQILLVVR